MWDFGDGSAPVLTGPLGGSVPGGTHGGSTIGTFKDPEHKYGAFSTYNVKLTVTTNDGCTNALTQKVFILPYNTVQPAAGLAYTEDFELNPGGWIAEGGNQKISGPIVKSDTSWIWGLPAGANISSAASGTGAWWTGKNSNSFYANENSWVNGPCFDLTQLLRPMVSLDYWSDTQIRYDGAVLEYSIDGGITWIVVGPIGVESLDQGINWFNEDNLLGRPGSQPARESGWTGTTNGWINGRYNLDMIDKAKRSQVRLRIAFGSDATNLPGKTYDGFAFDNFFVGEKRRNVLVEHFTNSNDNGSLIGDTYLDNLMTDQLTFRGTSDFSYMSEHINFPSPDALNVDNPVDPAARALFFGVSRPPATIMDGRLDSKFKGVYTEITRVELDREALEDPLFDLTLTAGAASAPNMISPQLSIKANSAFSAPLIAQVALVENDVSGQKNILRKLLFGTDGETMNNTWVKDQVFNKQRTDVEVNVPISNPSQLSLVGFIQDKNTKKIYQSVVIPAPVTQGAPIVGIEDPVLTPTTLNGIRIYPNPANGQFNFEIPDGSAAGYSWKVSDQRGVVVREGNFEGAIDHLKQVDVSNLANAVYFVIITGPGKSVVYQKLVVMNQN